MKKILRGLAALSLLMAAITGTAAAQSCSISGTGTGSTNSCTSNNDTDIDINNSNDVDCDVSSDQDADSGNAQANGNTTVGNVGSGDASNSADLGCSVNASNNGSQPGGGRGAGSQEVALSGGQGAGDVTALPETGADDVMRNIGIATAATSVAGVAAYGAAASYRRRVFNA